VIESRRADLGCTRRIAHVRPRRSLPPRSPQREGGASLRRLEMTRGAEKRARSLPTREAPSGRPSSQRERAAAILHCVRVSSDVDLAGRGARRVRARACTQRAGGAFALGSLHRGRIIGEADVGVAATAAPHCLSRRFRRPFSCAGCQRPPLQPAAARARVGRGDRGGGGWSPARTVTQHAGTSITRRNALFWARSPRRQTAGVSADVVPCRWGWGRPFQFSIDRPTEPGCVDRDFGASVTHQQLFQATAPRLGQRLVAVDVTWERARCSSTRTGRSGTAPAQMVLLPALDHMRFRLAPSSRAGRVRR
jgi:hypothetical protein